MPTETAGNQSPFRRFRCSVSIRGNDKRVHTAEFEAASLFHAAEQGILQWCLYSWFSENQPVEVVAGEQRWTIDQEKVRRWRMKNRVVS